MKKQKLIYAILMVANFAYSQNYPANPDVIVTIFAGGPLSSSTVQGAPAVVSDPYNSRVVTGGIPNYDKIWATAGQVGSVYGIAYSHTQDKTYAAAYIKRHAELGPGNGGNPAGLGSAGAIYSISNPPSGSGPGTVSVLLDIGAAAGTTARTTSSNWICDPVYYEVGRVGWGDIDVSPDGNTLWAMNLYNKSLYKISLPSGAILGTYAIPGVTGGPSFDAPLTTNENLDFRPAGLKVTDTKVYVGVISSGESLYPSGGLSGPCNDPLGTPALRGYVFEFNISGSSYNTTPVLDFPFANMTWNDGFCTTYNSTDKWTYWQPNSGVLYSSYEARLRRPLITDIEMIDGDLLIGIRNIQKDKQSSIAGLQYPNCSTDDSDGGAGGFGGQTLRACASGSTWTIENNGMCGGMSGYNSTVFYNHKIMHGADHAGSIALKTGSGELLLPSSPGGASGSMEFYLETTHTNSDRNTLYNLYAYPLNTDNFLFGKSNGLGDVDLLTSAPVVCSLSNITTVPGTCNTSNNQYTLTGAITFTNPPATGTLTVSVSGGGSQVFNAPFTSPQNYSISGLTSDGVSHIVTAVFSDDAACTGNATYTAPANCYCTPSCLLTASFFQDVILGFDGTTYNSEGQGTNGTCTLDGTYDMAVGPDGNLYISSSLTNTVLKFDISTVTCLGTFISAGSGGLNNPRGLTFLPNGDLLVNSHNSGQILRYNGTSGAFIGVFSNGSDISPIASMAPHMHIKVGPDGAVWVADHTNNRILRFNATTGAFLSVFAQLPAGSGVRSFEFVGSTVLISRHNVDIVAAYNYNTGAYISDFADAGDGIDGPTGITYGPDGKVYIGSLNTNQIIVFNTSGVQLSTITVDSPKDILFKCGACFSPTCSISTVTATPGNCNSSNNQYTLTGTITFANAPTTGTLTVSVSGGGSQVFNAPFTSPQNYSISGLTSDGLSHTVTAVFSDDAACTANTTYTAPASCTNNPITCPGPYGGNGAIGDPAQWVVIGDPGNPADGPAYSTMVNGSPIVHNDPNQIGYGSVNYTYSIADGFVTIKDYLRFLNAVDPTNTLNFEGYLENIGLVQYSGGVWSAGASYCYGLSPAEVEKVAVTRISLNQKARYANWVATGNVNTGAYTFASADGNANITAIDNTFTGVRLLTENEYYKAAFWDQANNTYNLYGTTGLQANGTPIVSGIGPGGVQTNNLGVVYTLSSPDPNICWPQVQSGQGGRSAYGVSNMAGGFHNSMIPNAPSFPITNDILRPDNLASTEVGQRSSYRNDFTLANQFYPSPSFQLARTGNACICEVVVVTADPTPCNSTDNTYNLSGMITFPTAPTSGTLTISVPGGTPLVLNPPFLSPIAYSLTGLTADGTTKTVTAEFSSSALCIGTKDFTAPANCLCSISSVTATPGTCNPTNNQYTLTGTITFANPPATGTLTVSVSGGGSQVFNAPFTSPQNYSISGLTSDGVSHTVTAVFSDDAACTGNATYTAPASCALPGCNCTDMIYLNDETRNEVHKFSVNAGTGAISEIGSPWLPSSAGVTFPHGVAIDLNGFVYISHPQNVISNIFAPWDNHFTGGKSYKLKSNGTVLNPNPAPTAVDFTVNPPNEWGPNYGSENGYIYVPNNLNETVDAYDLCTGDYVGSMTVARTGSTPHEVMSWGFIVENGNWYWSNIGANKSVYTGSTDISLYNVGATNNGIELFNHGIPPGTVNTLLFDDVAMGITKDIAGNFYIIRGHINGTGPARIRKYGPTGVFISEISDGTNSGANTTNGVAGFFGARGIAYSKESGLLYVGNFENCVTVFDTNLVQQTALNIGNPTAGRPKGIGIITECCPNQTTMTETRDICYNGTPEKHFLQEVLSCGEGTITEGNWTEESNTSGGNITFNACDLSVTVSGSNGCAVYRLQKTTPAGGNEQCGAFDISLTICASPAPLATVSGNQGTCTGSAPNNDATVNITSATNADQAGISTGATYTGPVYNGAGTIDISSGSGSFTNLIHNTQYTVRLFNGSNDCYKDTTLTTPNIVCNVCSVSVMPHITQCNNNNTPANSSDDWFTLTVTGTVTNGSGNYVVKIGAYTSPVTSSGTPISITGNGLSGNPLLQANGTGTYLVRIEDTNDSSCFTTIAVGPVQSCSNCPDPNCFNITKQIIR